MKVIEKRFVGKGKQLTKVKSKALELTEALRNINPHSECVQMFIEEDGLCSSSLYKLVKIINDVGKVHNKKVKPADTGFVVTALAIYGTNENTTSKNYTAKEKVIGYEYYLVKPSVLAKKDGTK